MAATLDDAPLVRDDRTEVAAAEAAALRDKAELDFLDGRHAAGLLVDGMIGAHVGQVVDLIHLLLRERQSRRILHDAPLIILLHEAPAAYRILLEVLELECLSKALLVRAHLRKGRQFEIIPGIILIGHAVARALDDIADLDALLEVSGNLDDGAFPHAVDQEVSLAVNEDGAAYRIRPVIVMRHAPQARLDAADDDGHIGVELTQAVAVDDRRALWPMAGLAARRVSIFMADFLGRRELVEQGIHVASRDEEAEARLPEAVKVLRRMPVRLRDDADLVAVLLEQTADDGRAETRVVDIGITRDEDEIELVPAALFHVAPADW